MGEETVGIELAIALLQVALEKGIPVVMEAIQDFNKEEITLEDIEGLRTKIKPPDQY